MKFNQMKTRSVYWELKSDNQIIPGIFSVYNCTKGLLQSTDCIINQNMQKCASGGATMSISMDEMDFAMQ